MICSKCGSLNTRVSLVPAHVRVHEVVRRIGPEKTPTKLEKNYYLPPATDIHCNDCEHFVTIYDHDDGSHHD